MSVNKLGAGRFILNTLRVRENLDKHPAADRLLLNMLRYAATDAGKPIADVPAGFSEDLMRMGFQNK